MKEKSIPEKTRELVAINKQLKIEITAMQNIIDVQKALELLENEIRKMGGGIIEVDKISTNYDQTFATVTIVFKPDILREYNSQLP